MRLNPSPELSARIQQLIDAIPSEYVVIGSWDPYCKLKLNALPLYASSSRHIWALRPDGVVLCLDIEPAALPVEEETDPSMLLTVLLNGAREYPELQPLVPPRPEGFHQCDACAGSGYVLLQIGTDQTYSTCGRCHGFGWSISPPQDIAQLIALLDNPYVVVRSQAAQVLGQVGDAGALPALTRVLATTADGSARRTIESVIAAIWAGPVQATGPAQIVGEETAQARQVNTGGPSHCSGCNVRPRRAS